MKLSISLHVSLNVLVALVLSPAAFALPPSENLSGLAGAFVKENLDLRCLDDPNCEAQKLVTVRSDGSLKIEEIGGHCPSSSDNFYREQAIWEASPLSKSFDGQQISLGGNGVPVGPFLNGPCPEFVEYKSKDYVLLHLIPSTAGRQRPAWNSSHADMIHNPKNVLRLKVTKLQDPQLAEFRMDWVNFFIQHQGAVTDTAVQKEASKIKRKYSKLFS